MPKLTAFFSGSVWCPSWILDRLIFQTVKIGHRTVKAISLKIQFLKKNTYTRINIAPSFFKLWKIWNILRKARGLFYKKEKKISVTPCVLVWEPVPEKKSGRKMINFIFIEEKSYTRLLSYEKSESILWKALALSYKIDYKEISLIPYVLTWELAAK